MFVHQEKEFTIIANEMEEGKDALVCRMDEKGRSGDHVCCKISKIIREKDDLAYRDKVDRVIGFADRSPYDYFCEFQLGGENGKVFAGMNMVESRPENLFTLEATIEIPQSEVKYLTKLLQEEPKDESECLGEDETISYTAHFADGNEMDVKVCGVQYREGEGETNTAWSEAVLFNSNGCEIGCSDAGDDLLGDWEMEHNGILYRATVVQV